MCNNLTAAASNTPARGQFVPLLHASNANHSIHAYLLTLNALRPAEDRLHRMLNAALKGTPASLLRVTAMAAVRGSEALKVAGVAPSNAKRVFGQQASHAEFLNALGCALSHLRAARRALLDGASPALILEEDAVSDLTPLWPMGLNSLIRTLPDGWEGVQLSVLATSEEWDELRASWRTASNLWGGLPLVRQDYYWSTAAYLLHERGARRLVEAFSHTYSAAAHADAASNVTAYTEAALDGTMRWDLGLSHSKCVQADNCVIYPSLSRQNTFVAVPPFFTCAESKDVSSSIAGHGMGVQREVHLLSRLQSLDFAAEAYRKKQRPQSSHRLADACALVDANSSNAHRTAFGNGHAAANKDLLGNVLVHRRLGGPSEVMRFDSHAAINDGLRGVAFKLVERTRFEMAGRWEAYGRALLVQWLPPPSPTPPAVQAARGGEKEEEEGEEGERWEVTLTPSPPPPPPSPPPAPPRSQLYCRVDRADGAHTYVPVVGGANTGGDAATEELAPLLPPQASMPPSASDLSAHSGYLPFKFWIHDSPSLWWLPLLQCTPDWDIGLDSQNTAEVWLLLQLLTHPNRTHSWKDASVIILPLLPKTSLHAGGGAWSSPRWTGNLPRFTLHVFRDLLCFPLTPFPPLIPIPMPCGIRICCATVEHRPLGPPPTGPAVP